MFNATAVRDLECFPGAFLLTKAIILGARKGYAAS